jgi:transposase InsO family protein
VIDVLLDLFILRGPPGYVRSEKGPAFIARAVQEWIAAVGSRTADIEPGSPWENSYCKSFNSKLLDERKRCSALTFKSCAIAASLIS